MTRLGRTLATTALALVACAFTSASTSTSAFAGTADAAPFTKEVHPLTSTDRLTRGLPG